MNALEQMAKAMIEKAITNLPPEIQQTIGQIGEIVKGVKGQLDRIENQQRLIMTHLKIPDDQPQEQTDAETK